MNESKFRERRSAFREEPEAQTPTAEAETPTAEPELRPVEPETRQAEPVTAASAASAPIVPPAPDGAQEPPAGEEIDEADLADAYLDQLAGMDAPPPTFLELIEPHVERALGFLGQLPLTPEGDRRVLPQWAKREIDLLGLLEQRTRGNLSPDEQQALDQTLDQLRTLFLKVAS